MTDIQGQHERRRADDAATRRAIKRKRVLGTTLVAGMLAGASALPARSALPPGYGGELRLPAPGVLGAPDPLAAETPLEVAVAASVFDPLYRVRSDGRVVPVLAAELPVREGTAIRVPLRTNLRRHDGRKLQARDVARSLERAARSRSSWLLSALAPQAGRVHFRVSDDGSSIVIGTSSGNGIGNGPAADSGTGSHVASEAPAPEAPAHDEAVARLLAAGPLGIVALPSTRRPVGTGPFTAQREDRSLVLHEYPHTPAGAPYLMRVRWLDPRERDRELRDLELGRIDGSWHGRSLYGGSPVRPVVESSATAELPVLLVRNTDRSPLSDGAVWAAVAHGLDRERLERIGVRGTDRLVDGLPPPRTPRARARTARSRVTLRLPVHDGDVFEERLAEALAGILDEAGFGLAVSPLPASRFDAAVRAGRWDLRLVTVVPPLPGRAALIAAAFAAAGQEARAREIATGLLADRSPAAASTRHLDAIVLGRRVDTLYHRADLRDVRLDALGRLDLAAMHLARHDDGRMPR